VDLDFKMAAFNWIVFDGICPKCSMSATLRAQCHIASSFDGEDGKRFCNAEYRIGDSMPWWPIGHPRWRDWRTSGRRVALEAAQECCYTECRNCGADLYAVIEVASLAPRKIVDTGMEKDWPADFEK
jgi:hypothetical protein